VQLIALHKLQFLKSKEVSSYCSNELAGSFDCFRSKDGMKPFESPLIMDFLQQFALKLSFKGC
jgi:hypothetical protein